MSGGRPSQRCIDFSQPEEAGAGKSGSAKQPTAMPIVLRVAVAFPEDAGAAIRAEVEADLIAAVGHAAIDFVLAFDPHLVFRPAAAVMDDGAGAALAGLAMADIDGGGSPDAIALSWPQWHSAILRASRPVCHANTANLSPPSDPRDRISFRAALEMRRRRHAGQQRFGTPDSTPQPRPPERGRVSPVPPPQLSKSPKTPPTP